MSKPTKCLSEAGPIFVIGTFAGFTVGKISRLIQAAGGSVTTDYTDDNVVRAIIGPAVWGLESTMGASPVLKQIRTANQENEKNSKESDSDPHEYRVWLLSLEWLLDTLEQAEIQPEEGYDYELKAQAIRDNRSQEAAADRKANGGKSRYGVGNSRYKVLKEKAAAEEEAKIELEAELLAEQEESRKKMQEETRQSLAAMLERLKAENEAMKISRVIRQAAPPQPSKELKPEGTLPTLDRWLQTTIRSSVAAPPVAKEKIFSSQVSNNASHFPAYPGPSSALPRGFSLTKLRTGPQRTFSLPDSDSEPEVPLQSLPKSSNNSKFINSANDSSSSSSESTPLAQRKISKAPRRDSFRDVIEISDSEPDVPLIRLQSAAERLTDLRSQREPLKKSSAPSTSTNAQTVVINKTAPVSRVASSPHSSPTRPSSMGLMGSSPKRPHEITAVRVNQVVQKVRSAPRTGNGNPSAATGHVAKKAKIA